MHRFSVVLLIGQSLIIYSGRTHFYAQNIICIIMYLCIYFLIVVMKTFKHHSGVSAAVCLPMMHLTEVTQTLWALQTGFTLYLTHL